MICVHKTMSYEKKYVFILRVTCEINFVSYLVIWSQLHYLRYAIYLLG